jgi:hypothetical protein
MLFFSYVAQITNNSITDLLLSDSRFVDNVIDTDKVYQLRLGLKFKKSKLFRVKSKCIITGRHRAKISFLVKYLDFSWKRWFATVNS